MAILIPGTLGYELKRDFLSDNLEFRKVETFNYEIYAADFEELNTEFIQQTIKGDFEQKYKGDIKVKVFSTQNTLQFPSDSIRAAKYNVTVEIVSQSNHPVEGVNSVLTAYGTQILNFKEEFSLSRNQNGNKELNHSISFGIRDETRINPIGSDAEGGATRRKEIAQSIASSFLEYQDLSLTIVPDIVYQDISNPSNYKIYNTETYDLYKNNYSFSKKREFLPLNQSNINYNLSHSFSMAENGIIEVTEKVNALSNLNFDASDLDILYGGSYGRCSSAFSTFLSKLDKVGNGVGELLINIPIKSVKNYNRQSLSLSYDVTYTNNPELKENKNIISEIIEFSVDPFGKVEGSHSFEYTINKTSSNASNSVQEHMASTQNLSLQGLYAITFPILANKFPNFRKINSSATFPNIRTRASVKYTYSNNPIYFQDIQGINFKSFEIFIDNKKPSNIINEYKVINRTSRDNQSVLSYAYQSEKGEVQVRINAVVGKYNKQFVDFSNIAEGVTLTTCLEALYREAGARFLPTIGQQNQKSSSFNWFISDSSFSFDSDSGTISVSINYVYTLKLRNG